MWLGQLVFDVLVVEFLIVFIEWMMYLNNFIMLGVICRVGGIIEGMVELWYFWVEVVVEGDDLMVIFVSY